MFVFLLRVLGLDAGMLTIDFVSLDKERLQARHVKPMRPREFKALCWALFGFNFSNCHNNKENIIFLRKMSVRVYFSCEQVHSAALAFRRMKKSWCLPRANRRRLPASTGAVAVVLRSVDCLGTLFLVKLE